MPRKITTEPVTDVPVSDLAPIEGLTASRRAALLLAIESSDGRVRAVPNTRNWLENRKFVQADHARGGYYITERGRRAVRWYVEEVAAWWGTSTNAVHKAIHQSDWSGDGRVLIPEPQKQVAGRNVRSYWTPETIREFVRPGPGRRTDIEAKSA
jgi:hypothetical protein